ncbi:hypothetical protein FUA48_04940 [Flavobacterium alkalisoli]|uniref:DUF4783 domain-containing protein n=1 Tax=Flavobacterium alkalisoli TaxID=2602769 RepID=A0A5B9FWA5_9FLAO|nr:hypothetical protein [Flavobacterium alkalisoli]QEE48947.1 hypothetical protein FUA48_04940 [Flavobacterium alkalisoli]
MKKITLLLFLFLGLSSFAQENGVFVVSEGDKKITVVLDTKLPYLELNKPTLLKTYFENIDIKNSSSIARGLRKKEQCGDNCAAWELIIDEKGVVDGYFKITFYYELSGDRENKKMYVSIPVKD